MPAQKLRNLINPWRQPDRYFHDGNIPYGTALSPTFSCPAHQIPVYATPRSFLNHLLTHVILVGVACGSNILPSMIHTALVNHSYPIP